MKNSGNAGGIAWPRSALGAVLLVVVGAVFSGCTGGYEKMSSQPFDTDYEIFSVVGRAGNLDLFLIKKFKSEGMVAFCGGYTLGTSSFSKQGNRRWADISQIYIGDVRVGTAAFMAQMPVYGFKQGEDPKAVFIALAEKDISLPCVRSKVPWNDEFESIKVERRGPDSIRVYD